MESNGIQASIFSSGGAFLVWARALAFVPIFAIAGCTSLGHESRAQPQIERPLPTEPNAVAVVGSGELSTAIELMLVSRGIRVHASPIRVQDVDGDNPGAPVLTSRYVINVTSVDLDMCLPEGSRQMHFNISVVDLVADERLLVMSGDFGCKDTLVQRFQRWFFTEH